MKRRITNCLVLTTAFLFVFISVSAQNKSNKGKEFWLGYGNNVLFTYPEPVVGANSQTLVLYLSAEQAAVVTVSINSTGWTQTVNIPANTVNASIVIPKTGTDDARLLTDGLFTKGIHIVSDVPIVVYAHQYGSFSSAATMLMPVETYGYIYYSLNYYQKSNYAGAYSWFYIIAAENNTKLLITPSDTTVGGWFPNNTYTVTLNKGEIYNVMGKLTSATDGKDMSGSKVLSVTGADGNCHPVAVFSGSSRNILYGPNCSGASGANGNGGELMMQQVFPAQAWGTKYLTHHNVNNPGANLSVPFLNIYRVAVTNPATIVKRNGIILTGLINNFFYEFTSTSGDFIESDQPVLVGQYLINANQCTGTSSTPMGDPEMIYLSPIEQGVKAARFYITANQSISLNNVNIITPVTAITSVKIDGIPLDPSEYITHPNNSNYAVASHRFFGIGQHDITCDSVFVATCFGMGDLESYSYNVGCNINNLNFYSTIANTHNTSSQVDTFTCKNTPVRFFLKIAEPATSIHWKLSQVPGMSPNVDSIINAPVPANTELINGRTYYVYTLQQDFIFSNFGTFYVPVTYTSAVVQNCSQEDSATVKVVVNPGPVADFSISALNCLKDTIHFTGISNTAGFNIASYQWDFDDATTQSMVNAKKRFATSGLQNVRYRIFADNGCVGDTTKILTILPSPTAVVGVSTPACASDSVLVSDTSAIPSGSIVSWRYDFGDATTLVRTTNTNFYHTYTSPGTFIIKLVTTSNNGCISDTAYKSVTVFAKPIALFGSAIGLCVGDSVHITDTSSIALGAIASWHYNFGDGNTLIKNNNTAFYHPYNTAGTFILSLVTISDMGCKSDTFRRVITVSDKPRADFTVSALNCLKDTVFLNHITPPGTFNITGYLWNFDDATTQGTINAKKKFATAGVQNIRYRIFTAEGCTGDTTKTINIFDSPIARLGVTPVNCVDSVLVSDTSSIAAGTITSWRYNFGDATTLIRTTNTPFYHHYALPGTYTVSLVTTSATGCTSDTSRKTISIFTKPYSDFTITANNCLRDTVFFNHINPPGTFNITGYLWSFDDATTQNTLDAKKKFATAGLQNIRYRIFTAEGCTGDTTKTITIAPDPNAKPGILAAGCVNAPMQITDTSSISSGTIVSWQYNFGDLQTLIRAVNTPFTHTYTTAGTYTLTLITTSPLGCKSDTAKKTITIYDKPLAPFSFTGTPCVGNSISFTSGYTNTAGTSWYWDFGDAQILNTTTGNTATHIYTTAQTNISVKHVVSIVGSVCPADTTVRIIPIINQNPIAAFSIKKDTACQSIPLAFTSSAAGISTWNWDFGNGTGTTTPPFTRGYSNAGTYNVSLTVTDANNCKSILPATDILIINPTPVVNAGADKIASYGYPVMLDASVSPPSSYTYLWTPSAGLSATNILKPMALPVLNTTYVLQAQDVNTHCKATDAVLVKSVTEVYIPNAFTPNGDTKNDKWEIPSLAQYPGAVVTIFNTYGQKIFETTNYVNNLWDGTFKGAKQPIGSYVYYIKLNDNRNQVFQGLITIIR